LGVAGLGVRVWGACIKNVCLQPKDLRTMPPQKQHESKAARPHGMESVTLCRATTPDQRRAVVALVQSWFEREG